MEPLETQRIQTDLTVLFSVVRGLLDIQNMSFNFSKTSPNRILITRIHSKRSQRHFIHRSVMYWNKIVKKPVIHLEIHHPIQAIFI